MENTWLYIALKLVTVLVMVFYSFTQLFIALTNIGVDKSRFTVMGT